MFLLILFLIAQNSSDQYIQQIEQERHERNELFADPIRSPLATVGIVLLDRPEIVFGGSAEADLVWVDFNRAFHPSCVYGDGFACPLPRPGTRRSVAATAGEKTYPKEY